MSGPPSSSRPSVVLLVVVLVALAIGGAASLVAGAANASPYRSGPYAEVTLSTAVLEATLFGVLAVGAGLLIWVRLGSSTQAIPGRFVAFVLAVLLVGVVFVVLLQVLGSGGAVLMQSPGNASSSSSSSPSNTTANGALGGPGGYLASLGFPSWTLYVLVAAIVLLAAAVALPAAWSRFGGPHRQTPSRKPARADVDAALATAARGLESGGDPRAVILALYAVLLRRVDPIVDGIDTQTPTEIRDLHLSRVGIRASAADALTRLFEEARYSSHPMSQVEVDEARWAIDAARADLDRTAVAP